MFWYLFISRVVRHHPARREVRCRKDIVPRSEAFAPNLRAKSCALRAYLTMIGVGVRSEPVDRDPVEILPIGAACCPNCNPCSRLAMSRRGVEPPRLSHFKISVRPSDFSCIPSLPSKPRHVPPRSPPPCDVHVSAQQLADSCCCIHVIARRARWARRRALARAPANTPRLGGSRRHTSAGMWRAAVILFVFAVAGRCPCLASSRGSPPEGTNSG